MEEYFKVLQSRGVALINVDIAVKGNISLEADAVPLLYRSLIRAAGFVPNPNPQEVALGRATMLDSWQHYRSPVNKTFLPGQNNLPYIGLPGSGSDHQRFLAYVGVPVVDMAYRCEPRHCYMLYHSMYEISWLVENLVDKGFKTHVAMGKFWCEVVRNIADSLVVPFNTTDYGVMLNVYIQQLDQYLQSNGFNQPMAIPNYSTVIGYLKNAGNRFLSQTKVFQTQVDAANSGSTSMAVTMIEKLNTRLVALERSFINPRGLPNRPDYRHVIFSSSIHNSYAGVTFAGITDSAEYYLEGKASGNATAMGHWLKQTRLGITVLQYSIESAILVLNLN